MFDQLLAQFERLPEAAGRYGCRGQREHRIRNSRVARAHKRSVRLPELRQSFRGLRGRKEATSVHRLFPAGHLECLRRSSSCGTRWRCRHLRCFGLPLVRAAPLLLAVEIAPGLFRRAPFAPGIAPGLLLGNRLFALAFFGRGGSRSSGLPSLRSSLPLCRRFSCRPPFGSCGSALATGAGGRDGDNSEVVFVCSLLNLQLLVFLLVFQRERKDEHLPHTLAL
mmetsp:Transcript_43114/g.106446  ORF Transcript_43114/g.106446 Transcript_43114/m.106446 type:complete len:223 (+) Transcript_43114:1713-2381(+)